MWISVATPPFSSLDQIDRVHGPESSGASEVIGIDVARSYVRQAVA